MSTSDRSHRDDSELEQRDDLLDPQLEPPAPEPVVVNADAEQAAAAQRAAGGEKEGDDLDSIHRRVFTGDLPPPPPPPRTWTVGGPDDGAPPPSAAAPVDDDPEAGNTADAWSRRRGPPPPSGPSFTDETSWACLPSQGGGPGWGAAYGPSWARPSSPDGSLALPPPETSWARS
ncbi:MAG TPA: hypothetical protein VL172_07950 [Kofleriaceae bacterium]|jgi:hypothetical protein|nr:hypothetical protein [Kofleriaceae bacterium]